MTSYDLEGLGSEGFQDMAGSLAVATFGPSVQVMGPGRDGGRDMYVEGAVTWSDPATSESEPSAPPPSETWTGYTVFQVKRKDTIAARPQDNAAWLWAQVKAELDDWVQPATGRDRTPRQLVFVTNVPLTPTPGSGGHDSLQRQITDYDTALADPRRDIDDSARDRRLQRLRRLRRINKIHIWDRGTVEALLDIHHGVRRAYKALLTVPDVIADLAQINGNLPAEELEDGLRRHARAALIGDGRLNFDDAGGDSSSTAHIHEVVIDLPVVTDADRPSGHGTDPTSGALQTGAGPDTQGHDLQRRSLINLVLDQADHVLKPLVTVHTGPRHIIVTGDPGNGKSTISKFLTQAYRAALLQNAANLGADHRALINGTGQALQRFGRSLPHHPRWPIRIDLAEYAQERGHLIDDTLLRWVAEKVNAQSNTGTVTPRAMTAWQREWPWFVVFDGLDEVTEPTVRAKVVERVVSFVNDADGDNCDIFVLLTTRPVGYTENISPTHFRTLSLADLTPEEAVQYGLSVTTLRLRDDPERRDAVCARLAEAAESESFRHLLRTPLQVLILTVIIEGSAGNLAPDRFSLFWGYFRTIFVRERNKPTSLRTLLRDYDPQITMLHERIGFDLQTRSEHGDRSFAALTDAELHRVIHDVLIDTGHPAGVSTDELHQRLYTAATQRLVLIAPRGKHGFGFDVRPLQELSAARHLTNGEFDDVAENLELIAASPHWRNTWIFAAGRLFADGQNHKLPQLLNLVETIDSAAPHRLGRVVPVAPRLALSLLDDGMARAWPAHSARLLTLGLQALHEPAPSDLAAITRTLVRYADRGQPERASVVAGLRALLGGPSVTRDTVGRLQRFEVGPAELQVGVRPLTRGLHAIRKDPADPIAVDPTPVWPDFWAEIETAPLETAQAEVLHLVADGIASHTTQDDNRFLVDSPWQTGLQNVLADSASATALESALQHVTPGTPMLFTALRDDVMPRVHRQAVTFTPPPD